MNLYAIHDNKRHLIIFPFFFFCSFTTIDSKERTKRSVETSRIRRSRDKRSSSHKHLEVAMVADDLVVKIQGEQNLHTYLLMLAHLVSKVRLQNQYLRVYSYV